MHHIFLPYLFVKKHYIYQCLNQIIHKIIIHNISLTLILYDLSASNFVMAIDYVHLFSIKTYRTAICATHHKTGNIHQYLLPDKESYALQ